MDTLQPDFGRLVRQARERSRLSREHLAKLTSLSVSTIKNIESGHDISPTTLRSLIAVRELALPEELVAQHLPEPARPNAWYAPGFSPVAEFRSMLSTLQGAGGTIEQTYLYFDHASAADWCAISSQRDYADADRSMPLDRAAAQVFRLLGPCALDIIALGPGDGRLETRFVTCLADLLDHPALRLYLLDISQPLLAEAYRHAVASLADRAMIVAIQGDFFRLPQYTQLLYVSPAAPRRQLLLLLGSTLANLDNECRFLRDSLCGFSPGTLLLVDYPCRFGQHPDEIRARDPWLATGKPALGWRDKVLAFWSGPLRRYVPGFRAVDITMELSTSLSPIPESYTVEARARVHVEGGPDRTFSIFRIRRHQPLALAQAFAELGWDGIDGWPYGADVGYPRALHLFRKR